MKVTILHFIICRSIHGRNLSESLQFCLSISHKNCMLTTKIIVRRLHWHFRALCTLLFIFGVHNQMFMYTTEFWLDKFYIWVHKCSFLLKWRFVYTAAPTAWFLCTSESLRWVFSVPKSSQGTLFCTKEYKMHSCVISSDFVCVHKSTYWNVVDARVHQQFYCVSCGGINNLIWIFSLHFDIRYPYYLLLILHLRNR